MAQIDSRIALGFQPQTQMENPVNALARMMQVQGLQQQNQLGQMKMDEYRAAGERRNKLAALLQGQYETPEAREDALLRGGFMEEATKLGTDRRANQKSDLEIDTNRQKLATERYNTYKMTTGALAQRPDLSKDMVVMAGQELVNAGILPMEMYQKSIANLPDDPNVLRARLREGVAAQLTPEQMLTVFAPKAEKIDNGQTIAFRDMNPNSPTYGQATGGATVQKQMTPGEVSSAETARRGQDITVRGQNMADARAREKNSIDRDAVGKVEWKQGVNGEWVGLPKEVSGKGPVAPVTTTVPGKRETQATNAINILNEAEKLIDKATGSYAGAAVDAAARTVGGSFESGDAIAQLQALEGALMMAQPRMEGPQSDKDVMLYRQMAGRLGDPTVPASQKKAAIKTIKSIHAKYANVPQSGGVPSQSPGMPSAGTVQDGYRFKGGDPSNQKNWEKL